MLLVPRVSKVFKAFGFLYPLGFSEFLKFMEFLEFIELGMSRNIVNLNSHNFSSFHKTVRNFQSTNQLW